MRTTFSLVADQYRSRRHPAFTIFNPVLQKLVEFYKPVHIRALLVLVMSLALPACSDLPSRVSIRVEPPRIARGPAPPEQGEPAPPEQGEMDNAFNAIRLSNGQWRGFTSGLPDPKNEGCPELEEGCTYTYAVDGPAPWSMGGERRIVLRPGVRGSSSECGRWLNDTERWYGAIIGFVHAEKACDYTAEACDPGKVQTHKSMEATISYDEGKTWGVPYQIITGTDDPKKCEITGEGDCTVVNGGDGYYYAYCNRTSDSRTIVARAPTTPGTKWRKYRALDLGLFVLRSWNSNALGGGATSLGPLGMAAGRWVDTDYMVLLDTGMDDGARGLKMSLSANKVDFVSIPDPLLVRDGYEWARPEKPNPLVKCTSDNACVTQDWFYCNTSSGQCERKASTDLTAYVSVMNDTDGNNQIRNSFMLTYSYIEPYEDWTRYLVFRDVQLSPSPQPVTPQVGVALGRWYSASKTDRWSTTAPVPGGFSDYVFEGTFGYLMTRPHRSLPTVALEDCVSTLKPTPGRAHLITHGTCDHIDPNNINPATGRGRVVAGTEAGYKRLRIAGYVYAPNYPQPPNTVPLYRCYNQAMWTHFISNQSNCEGLGAVDWLVGYALAN